MADACVAGFVLAGGRSSRMGQDKALLMLEDRTLVERAVRKLEQVAATVCIVGSRPDMARYAPVVPDLREGQGPLAGIEAAFASSKSEWLLFLAVDMPFVPVALLRWWVQRAKEKGYARAAVFLEDGRPQPALCLLHRELGPGLSRALEQGRLRLMPAIRGAVEEIARRDDVAPGKVLWELEAGSEELMGCVSAAQWQTRGLWFANLNTPEEFRAATEWREMLED